MSSTFLRTTKYEISRRESTSPQNLNTILASMMRIGLGFTIPTYFRELGRCMSA